MSPLVLFALLLAAPEPPRFPSATEVAYVEVSVTHAGAPVKGLRADDLQVRDNGVPIHDFELLDGRTLPFTAMLVLDVSGSIDARGMQELRSAVGAMRDSLGADDPMGLIAIGSGVRAWAPPTKDRNPIDFAVAGMNPGGSTTLYDGIYGGLLLAPPGRAIVLVCTDGQDNLSWLSERDVARLAEQTQGVLEAVLVGSPSGPGRSALQELAKATGGRIWDVSRDRLGPAFAAVVESMRTRYILKLDVSRAAPGLHRLDLRLVRQKGSIQARPSYAVPRTRVTR